MRRRLQRVRVRGGAHRAVFCSNFTEHRRRLAKLTPDILANQ